MENNRISFPRNDRTRFLCRFCHTHILPGSDVLNVSNSSSTARILCHRPVNVRDEPSITPLFYRFLPFGRSGLGPGRVSFHTYPLTLMTIHCNACNNQLGRRSIMHPGVGLGHQPRPGRRWSTLNLDRLIFWNGTRMVYADTLQPVNLNHQ